MKLATYFQKKKKRLIIDNLVLKIQKKKSFVFPTFNLAANALTYILTRTNTEWLLYFSGKSKFLVDKERN